jgi:6-phosphogluconolactonase
MRIYIFSIFSFLFVQMAAAQKKQLYLFTGTYTSGKSEGIYVFRYQPDKHEATQVFTAGGIKNPSFLSLASDGKKLYAVSEMNGNDNAGRVVAFDCNASTGSLSKLNEQPSGGDDPCYITVDRTNSWVIVGNYSSGTDSKRWIPGCPTGYHKTQWFRS